MLLSDGRLSASHVCECHHHHHHHQTPRKHTVDVSPSSCGKCDYQERYWIVYGWASQLDTPSNGCRGCSGIVVWWFGGSLGRCWTRYSDGQQLTGGDSVNSTRHRERGTLGWLCGMSRAHQVSVFGHESSQRTVRFCSSYSFFAFLCRKKGRVFVARSGRVNWAIWP